VPDKKRMKASLMSFPSFHRDPKEVWIYLEINPLGGGTIGKKCKKP
jgi:hypothetical protein